MAKQRQISAKSALEAKEEDLRRLAKWNDTTFKYGEPRDWNNQTREEIIDYLQCQFIISTSWGKANWR